MKRIIAIITALIMNLTLLPVSFAAEADTASLKAVVKHGDYLDERLIELYDEESRGIIAFPGYEAMYDFDSGNLPQGVTPEKSEVEISNKYHGTTDGYSLKWTTQGEGSRLNLAVGGCEVVYWQNGASVLGTPLNARVNWYLTLGVFQETMPEDGVTRSFHIGLISGGKEVGGYDFYLHRVGWTFANNRVQPTEGTIIDSIAVTQIGGSGGEFYMDDVLYYLRNTKDLRNTPGALSKNLFSERASDYPTSELTADENEAFETIAQRVLPDPEPIEKLDEEQMEEFREYYKKWQITPVEGTDFVNGYCPLYFHRATPGDIVDNRDSYIMNSEYSYLCSTYKKLGSCYRAVQNSEQKEELKKYAVDIARLAVTYSNVPDSWYGGVGFADGAYYVRDALAEAGIAAEMARQLKEQYSVDKLLYSDHYFENSEIVTRTDTKDQGLNWSIDADSLNTGAISMMIALLVDENSPEKARDLYLFKDYADKLLMNYSPSTYGTLKPDGSMFHHWVNKYDYGWQLAWNGLTNYVYWLHDTPFSPSDETLERISHFAEVRHADLGKDGKGGVPGHQGAGIAPNGVLSLALSGTPDGKHEINPYRASEWLAYDIDNSYKKEFLAMGIKSADLPQTNLTLSYAMKNIHRRSGWRAQTYGQNYTCLFNEYSRPATLFFNMGGILLDKQGQHAAMLVNQNDNIYGRDTFNPAPGYNFSRAPGVTAPDIKDKTKLGVVARGSSPYVGGVSTQNGNGVFMNEFDAADNISAYSNTVAEDFRFKKSYFYFDNMIVCMASDIGYGGSEAVSTGIFQEKMTDEDSLTLAGGKNLGAECYEKTFNSDDTPWLSDNINFAKYYFFPGQSYTVTRGTQEFLFKEKSDSFDGKGDFVCAYINHQSNETKADNGSYAYVIAPGASEEIMNELASSMSGEVPEFEILRRDKKAHVVKSNSLDSTGYAVFDKNIEFDSGAVKKVSSPAALMIKEYENGSGMSLAVADPNLRIDRTSDNLYGWSIAQNLTVTLRGRWNIKESAEYTARDTQVPVIKYTSDGNTELTLSCSDGLTYEYFLENIDKPLEIGTIKTITLTEGSAEADVNGKKVSLIAPITNKNGVNVIAAVDIAKILEAAITWNEEENRAVIAYNDKQITFTIGSAFASIDNSVVILDCAAILENDRSYVPMSVLKDILKCKIQKDGNSVSYVSNDAKWRRWNEQPVLQSAPVLESISVDNKPLQYNSTTKEYVVEVPEGTKQLPEVTYTVSDDCTVTVNKATSVPDRTTLTVAYKNDQLNTAIYSVKFVYPNSDYRISASVIPQEQNAPENVMDGDFNSYWACDTDGGYIVFELEEDVVYSGIGLAFMSGNKRKSFFDVEVSDDGENWTMVYSNGETSGTTLKIERYDFPPTKGRFIRVKGYGNSLTEWFSLAEAEIYKTNISN